MKFVKAVVFIIAYLLAEGGLGVINTWLAYDNTVNISTGIGAIFFSALLSSSFEKKVSLTPLMLALAFRVIINFNVYSQVPNPAILVTAIIFLIPLIVIGIISFILSKVKQKKVIE